jgi:hypothetical protein
MMIKTCNFCKSCGTELEMDEFDILEATTKKATPTPQFTILTLKDLNINKKIIGDNNVGE